MLLLEERGYHYSQIRLFQLLLTPLAWILRQIFCIFLFLCAASLFGTIIAQVNEIVAHLTTKKKDLDTILEAYLVLNPRFKMQFSYYNFSSICSNILLEHGFYGTFSKHIVTFLLHGSKSEISASYSPVFQAGSLDYISSKKMGAFPVHD